jgi:hypothetical protein
MTPQVAHFLAHLESGRNLSPHTIAAYRRDLRDLEAFLGGHLGRDVSQAHLAYGLALHRLDLYSSLRRCYHGITSLRTVQEERQVQLLPYLGRLLQQDGPGPLPLYGHVEYLRVLYLQLVGVGALLNAAGLSPAAHGGLKFYHEWVSQGLGVAPGVLYGVRCPAGGYDNTILSKYLLCLELQ